MPAPIQSLLVLRCAALDELRSFESHFVFCTGLLQHLDPIEILNSDQLFLEVVRLEVFVGAEAKYLLLLELFHENLFHLSMGQLAIVIEA